MKKKVLSTLLAITMVAGMMTGCGKEEAPAATADTASTTADTASATADNTVAETGEEGKETGEERPARD